MKARQSLLLLCTCLIAPGLASAERRDHAAHVHGLAGMDVAALDGEVEIALRSPAMNLVGFEHAPRNEQERHSLHEALESLRDGASLFAFGDAACRLLEAEVGHEYESGHEHDEAGDDHAGHDHDHDEHGHEEDGHAHQDEHGDASHSEIRAHYRFRCENRPAAIEVKLLERFPLTESIRVQYLTDDAQGAQTLSPEAPLLRLE